MNRAVNIIVSLLLMRIRSVKPEFWAHEMHERISESAALLALALLSYADDEGRFKVQFPGIKAQLFTYRALTVPLPEAFDELLAERYLVTYKANLDGREVMLAQIVTFKNHQQIQRPVKSRFPAPPRDDSMSNTGALNESSMSNTGALNESSINTQGRLNDDSMGKEGRKGKEGRREGAESSHSPDPQFQEPVLEDVLAWASIHGVIEDCARKWFLEQQKMGWLYRGQPIKNWQAGLQSYALSWRANDFVKKFGGKNAGAETPQLAQLEAELEAETDPEKRRALREKIKTAGGGK